MAVIVKINPADNVAVAVTDVAAGEVCHIDGRQITAVSAIPAGHKMSLRNLEKGMDVIKYGYPIGHLTGNVREGELIDHRNLKTNLDGVLEYTYTPIPAAVLKASAGVTDRQGSEMNCG